MSEPDRMECDVLSTMLNILKPFQCVTPMLCLYSPTPSSWLSPTTRRVIKLSSCISTRSWDGTISTLYGSVW